MDRISDWRGFRRTNFTVAGCEAFLTEPPVPSPGKPWVWRATFPDFHAEIDVELLKAGWHIGYLETGEGLGCDAALDQWDAFYDEVTQRRGLHPRPAIEAVSRGGLYAYRYAARHPERVAAIYADTPVMDLKSWPGGKGRGRGAPDIWKIALQRYGFASEADALAYKGNPLDLLPTVAQARIPLRHVISLDDQHAPPEENTLEAQRRLKKRGWPMELVTVAHGTPESGGHHFTLPAVAESAAFLARHTRALPGGREYFTLREGIAPFGPSATVAFLGGSITAGGGWRERIEAWLTLRFPQTAFRFVRAGIPSLGSVPHAFRLERDVLAHGTPDLLFVEAAVNDPTNFTPPARMVRGMEGVVRHLRTAAPACDIVHLHFAMPEHVADYRAGRSPIAIRQHERVAARYGDASLDLAREVAERIAAGQFTWEADFKDLHPSPFGHQLYANSIIQLLETAWKREGTRGAHRLPAPVDARGYADGHLVGPDAASERRGFVLDPTWRPTDGKDVREGYVDVPALVGTQPGDRFALRFDGRAIGLMLCAGPDTGIVRYRIDGKEYPPLDTFTPWSAGLHLPWALLLADDLAAGPHVLELAIERSRNPRSVGTALRIVDFLVS